MAKSSGKSWKDVNPSIRFLKERLQTFSKSDIESELGKEVDRENIDPYMINEAGGFLRLSIINLLAYKYLVCGNYFAWSKETIYYSQFYIVSCFLRLKRLALVHLEFLDEKTPLTVKIIKPRNKSKYIMQKCNASGHQIAWNEFARLYPDLSSKKMGRFSIRQRTDWTYDLFYASQSTDKYSLEQAKDRCNINFLDPNYGFSGTAEAADYYQELMANFGYEEAGTGDYQKQAINYLTEIGKASNYKQWYINCFSEILDDITILQSPKETKEEISKWIKTAIIQIKKE